MLARFLTILVLVPAYGMLLFIGGLLWYFGWKHRNETMRTVGDFAVLIGLVADAALVTTNYLFNWVGLLQASMQ
jgi:hypothetical protein